MIKEAFHSAAILLNCPVSGARYELKRDRNVPDSIYASDRQIAGAIFVFADNGVDVSYLCCSTQSQASLDSVEKDLVPLAIKLSLAGNSKEYVKPAWRSHFLTPVKEAR
ncbi:hypothetical protein NDU88_002822 [Pleurodeles waltl]|uniref:Uncharacterized protein n=1 Tax=Pleurodeles waltl TaxID=8319 RepID=A0AAV7WRS8_PLEWA|nr:hypothetical protein NDU88_002822 [Pleurodeles waltl]